MKFKVTEDVVVDSTVVFAKGSIVKGIVDQASRCMAFGIRGRLGIKFESAYAVNGERIELNPSRIYIAGKNRMPWAIAIFCLTYIPFPTGSKATMPVGYKTQVTVLNNTTITL